VGDIHCLVGMVVGASIRLMEQGIQHRLDMVAVVELMGRLGKLLVEELVGILERVVVLGTLTLVV
jgi:hypothetical protein